MISDELKKGEFFSDIRGIKNKNPIQEMLIDSIEFVNKRVLKFYLSNASKEYDILPSDMLVMVAANIFANLAYNLISTSDSKTKIDAFNFINKELFDLNKKLFLMLETNYCADEKNIN